MYTQFLLQNAYFIVNVFASLVIFAVAWLYFDAWTAKKTLKEGLRILGLFLLSLSFLVQAAGIRLNIIIGIFVIFHIVGYALIIASLIQDPLIGKPKLPAVLFLKSGTFTTVSTILSPILAGVCGFLYLRKSTKGLERHLKAVSISFYILSIYELLNIASIFNSSKNINIYNLTSLYGPFWIAKIVVLAVFGFILGKWVWGYLLKRLNTQLFMIFTAFTLSVFLITAVSFTFLLLNNVTNEAKIQVRTDVKVLSFAIDTQGAQGLSDAEVIAQSPEVIQAVIDSNKLTLITISQNYLLTKKESSLVITDKNGMVLARGEDKERTGDSLSNDHLAKRVLTGKSAISVVVKDGVTAPEVSIRSAVPIYSGSDVIGSVMIGTQVDNAFVDGINKATGLAASIYGGNIISATSLKSADGLTRPLGLKEENGEIKKLVLNEAKEFTGIIAIANTEFIGAYKPLIDVDGNSVGMLFVGRPATGVFDAAKNSIEITFMVTTVLLALSILPAYLISKNVSGQLT